MLNGTQSSDEYMKIELKCFGFCLCKNCYNIEKDCNPNRDASKIKNEDTFR